MTVSGVRRVRRVRRVRSVLLGTLLASALVAWPAAPAQSHVRGVASWPASGEVLAAVPERVTVLYSDGLMVDPQVSVVSPAGEAVADGSPEIVGQAITQVIEASGVPGVYGATFEVTSDDGHVVEGYFEFTVDPNATPTGNPAGPAPEFDELDQTGIATDETAEDEDDQDGAAGMTLLLTGLAGAALLVVVIRLVGRHRRV